MQRAGNILDTTGLKGKIYQVEFELQKLHMLELHLLEECVPAQRRAAKDACTDLIEALLTIINDLEIQEEH